jgi:hypothetical protein
MASPTTTDALLESYWDRSECSDECEDCFLDYNFDSYINLIETVHKIQLNQNLLLSTCTCVYYFKNYICKHILTVAVTKKLLIVPVRFIDKVIGCKPKRGPKKKARSAFEKQ